MITVQQLTKSYGVNKGVFDLSFNVKQGEVFGFLGPNGAGKTTTIRHLLGFIRPDYGNAHIESFDCFLDAHTIQERLGYIAGEPSFIEGMKTEAFLSFLVQMRDLKDLSKMESLIDFFEFNTQGTIKKLSKGNRQKLAIVSAFMHDPSILVLDEPTSGLDPLMQSKFIDLIRREKALGKTILMSSHNFEEIERTCDRALIIKHGKQVALEEIRSLKDVQRKIYWIDFETKEEMLAFQENNFETHHRNNYTLEVKISGSPDMFLKALSKCKVLSLDVKHQSLEEIFMDFYREGGGHHE